MKMKISPRFPLLDYVELTWTHDGSLHRATCWPEIEFERLEDGRWVPDSPSEEACAAAALVLDHGAWRRYLAVAPAGQREFLESFRGGRIEALLVICRCPALFDELSETPALTAFVAAHASLRETGEAAWSELNAVHERTGLFGVLDWLGLPSSRQTLAILRNLADADVPKRLLSPLRSLLWEPDAIHALEACPDLTDEALNDYCRPLAA